MGRKWSNRDLPGALHFVTGNFLNRFPVFSEPECCNAFLEQLSDVNQKWPSKLIAYVLMPDHLQTISNPRDDVEKLSTAVKELGGVYCRKK